MSEMAHQKGKCDIQSDARSKFRQSHSRREFLISLGAGLAIAGYYLVGRGITDFSVKHSILSGASSVRPQLRDDVVLQTSMDHEGASLHAGDDTVFGVNSIGKNVLQQMNGRNTIHDIAVSLSRELGLPENDELRANVAVFAANVGLLGLLKQPFHATIYERVVS